MKAVNSQYGYALAQGLGRNSNKIGERIMKKSLITIACALVAPVAFAQTSTTTTEQTTTSAPATTTTTSTTYEAGTVTTYTPGKTIVVKDERGGPVSFALGTAARVVNGAGQIITAPLRAGQKVRVYYTGTGNTRVVECVQVEE
jgi:ABC-type Fe3+-hydroxamate transport system substrate-binding protein